MKRYVGAILAVTLLTGCAAYNPNQNTQGTPATKPVTTPTTTSEVISKLELGKTYPFPTVDIVFQNLYRSKDKSGAEGLLMAYTKKYRKETPQEELMDVQIEVFAGDVQLIAGDTKPGHELINYDSPELMPGGTLQNLVFFKAQPDQDLKLILKGTDAPEYHLITAYPTETVDLADLKKLLLDDRLKLNDDYTKNIAPKEDLSLVGQTVQFKNAEFKLTDVKFVVNEIIYGRDLIITYRYKPTPSGTKTDLNIKIQAFQYGLELAGQPIEKDARDTGTEFKEADFIVNYKMDGAIIIRISDPTVQSQLVFVPNDQWHSLVST